MLFNWFRGTLACLMDRCIDNNLIHILQCRSGGHLRHKATSQRTQLKILDWVECSLAEIAERLNHLTLCTRWKGINKTVIRKEMCLETYLGMNQTLDLFLQTYIDIMFIWTMVFTKGEALNTWFIVIQFVDAFLIMMIFLSLIRSFQRRDLFYDCQIWMPFYLNRVPCYQKVRFAIHKLTCGAKKWWFEVLESRAHTVKCLILSWQAWENY
jgi:hypothetical protein